MEGDWRGLPFAFAIRKRKAGEYPAGTEPVLRPWHRMCVCASFSAKYRLHPWPWGFLLLPSLAPRSDTSSPQGRHAVDVATNSSISGAGQNVRGLKATVR